MQTQFHKVHDFTDQMPDSRRLCVHVAWNDSCMTHILMVKFKSTALSLWFFLLSGKQEATAASCLEKF